MLLKDKTFLIVALLIAVVVIGGAVFITFGGAKERSLAADESVADAQVRFASAATPDRDADGLKDWEETLWGTDANDDDTDGDGTRDGEEISVGRDPTQASPGDTIIRNGSKTTQESEQYFIDEQMSETEKASRRVLETYLAIKFNPSHTGTLSEDERENLVSTLLARQLNSTSAETYTMTNIRTTVEVSPAAIKTYGNALGEAIFKAEGQSGDYVLTVVATALENEDPEELKKLKAIVSGYRIVIRRILGVPVPFTFAAMHINLANALANVAASIEKMEALVEDPLATLFAIEDYDRSAKAQNDAFGAINEKLTSSGTVFEKDSAGYAFTLLHQ